MLISVTLRYLHRYPLGTGGGTNIYTTTTYDEGAWYHAAMVKSVDTIALYINGELVDSAVDTSEFNPGDAFGVVLGILDHERAPGRLFPGAMDDVRIYDRVMSQEEIQAIRTEGKCWRKGNWDIGRQGRHFAYSLGRHLHRAAMKSGRHRR